MVYTAEDIRFTPNGQNLYAIALDWPGESLTISSLGIMAKDKIKAIYLLGHEGALKWEMTDEGPKIDMPGKKPCEHAYAFKVAYNERLPWVY